MRSELFIGESISNFRWLFIYSLLRKYSREWYAAISTQYICMAGTVKKERKESLLHIIWRFFYVSAEAMFKTSDSNRQDSSNISEARKYSANRKSESSVFPN